MKISEQIWPRMVVLITSIDKKGRDNIMTASFIMPVSFKPKYLAFSIAPTRLTFNNIKETKEFGFNICDEKMLQAAKICGTFSGKDKDKFEKAKLTKQKAKIIKSPLIKESPISFECLIEFYKNFGDHFVVVARVVNEIIRKKDFKPLLHKTANFFSRIK